ncbi:MAG: hypothetical protein ACTSRH_15360 [Promethearchaeota archaeon]
MYFTPFSLYLSLRLVKMALYLIKDAFLPLHFWNRLEQRKEFNLSFTSTWFLPERHPISCSWTFLANRISGNLNAICQDIASSLSKRNVSLRNAFYSSM